MNFKKNKINEARKFCNMMTAAVVRSSNRLTIGKTYWKQVALLKILYSQGIFPYTTDDLEQLQKAQNKAFRTHLQAPQYTPNCFLKGEISSSLMRNRDDKAKLLYARYIMNHPNNHLLKQCGLHRLQNGIDKWTKTLIQYMQALDVNIHRLGNMTHQNITEAIKEKDTTTMEIRTSTKGNTNTIQNIQYKHHIR